MQFNIGSMTPKARLKSRMRSTSTIHSMAKIVIVVVAIVIVAVAFGIGLHAQANLSAGLASIAAICALIAMISFHLLVARVDGIATKVGSIEKRFDAMTSGLSLHQTSASEFPPTGQQSSQVETRSAARRALVSESDTLSPEEGVRHDAVRDQSHEVATQSPSLSSYETSKEGAEITNRMKSNVVDGLVRQLAHELDTRSSSMQKDQAGGDVRITLPPQDVDNIEKDVASSLAEADTPRLQASGVDDGVLAESETITNEKLETLEDQQPSDKADGYRQHHVPADIIISAAQAGHVELFLQPILKLPERRVAQFEVLPRLRASSGEMILPTDYAETAEANGVITLIDQAMLGRTAQVLKKLKAGGQIHPIFCSPSLRALTDADFLRDFVLFMKGFKEVTGDIVIEVSEKALAMQREKLVDDLAALHRIGIRLAVSDVGHPQKAIELISGLEFSYIKVSAGVLKEHLLCNPETDDTIVKEARANSVELIVDEVDSDQALADAVAVSAQFAQGDLFSKPMPLLPDDVEERNRAA